MSLAAENIREQYFYHDVIMSKTLPGPKSQLLRDCAGVRVAYLANGDNVTIHHLHESGKAALPGCMVEQLI